MRRNTEAVVAASDQGDASQVDHIRREYLVHLVLDTSHPDRLIQAQVATNLLVRLFDRLSIEGANPKNDLNLPPSLCSRIMIGPENRKSASAVLVLSDVSPPDNSRALFVDNRGWTVYMSPSGPWKEPRRESNGLTAMYAATLGATECFNRAFAGLINGIKLIEDTYTYNLVAGSPSAEPDYEPSLESSDAIELDLLLAGAGAVGGAFIYALGTLPSLRGRIEVVDHETLQTENNDCYMLSSEELHGTIKADVVRRHLAQKFPLLDIRVNHPPVPTLPDVTIQGRRYTRGSAGSPGWSVPTIRLSPMWPILTYQQWHGYDGAMPRRLVVCAVDSKKGRRDIQFGMHKIVLNGWTETGINEMSFGVGRYTIGDRGCMACEYHEEFTSPPDAVAINVKRTGLPTDRVRELMFAPGATPSDSEILQIATHRQMAPEVLLRRRGQPLAAIIHEICAQATVRDQSRLGVSPAAHLAALVGTHLAVMVVLESLGKPAKAPVILQGDARTCPRGAFPRESTEPEPGCLCQHDRVQAYHKKLWGN